MTERLVFRRQARRGVTAGADGPRNEGPALFTWGPRESCDFTEDCFVSFQARLVPTSVIAPAAAFETQREGSRGAGSPPGWGFLLRGQGPRRGKASEASKASAWRASHGDSPSASACDTPTATADERTGRCLPGLWDFSCPRRSCPASGDRAARPDHLRQLP